MVAPLSGPVDLAGRVAVVTGGSQGIGRASALALAREGADIAIIDVVSAEETIGGVRGCGRDALGLVADVSDGASMRTAAASILSHFGAVDILVTAAGVLGSTAAETDDADWNRTFDVNVKGTYLAIQCFFGQFKERGFGKIVCIGSIAGRTGGIAAGPQYAASKGAVHALARWAAKAGAPYSIYANAIAPATVRTRMTEQFHQSAAMFPLGRLGEPEDIAEAVVFLSSPASNWITGAVMDVNGGILIA